MTTRAPICRSCCHCCGMDHPKPIKKEDDRAACRRYPPVITVGLGGTQTGFPIVKLDWSCGEFQARK